MTSVPPVALLALIPLAAFEAQDDAAGARIVLEALDGTTSVRLTGDPPIEDLARAGAAFARFEGVAGAEGDGSIEVEDVASLELAGGDRLRGAIRGGDGDVLEVELVGGVPLELSIDVIRSILLPARIPDSVTESPSAGEDGDRLYLRTGGSLDRATGFVDSFAEDGVVFEDARLGARTYEWNRVVALFVTPLDEEGGEDEAADEEGDPSAVSVTLRGGGRLTGDLVRIEGPVEGLMLALGEGAEVALPGAVLREVALDDGSFRFLGDVDPTDTGPSSLFGDDLGFAWPMQVDRNVRGGPLIVAGTVFARGLGVHAPSRITWSLAGEEWTELRLAAGIDDTGVKGSQAGAASFKVIGDGKVLWKSAVLRAGVAPARPDPIDVKGVEELVLEVDPAGPFTLDRADWLRPMLVR